MKKLVENVERIKDILQINVIKSPNSPVIITSKCSKCNEKEYTLKCGENNIEIDWL